MVSRLKKGRNLDYLLLFAVCGLTLFGLIAVWATSITDAMKWSDGRFPLQFVTAQMMWTGVAGVAAFIAYKLGYRFLSQISMGLMFITIALLVIVFIAGRTAYGSSRWIEIGGFSLQPSEMLKPVMIIYLARWLSSKGAKLHDKDAGLIPFVLMVGICVTLILLQPNLSTAFILGAVALIMFLMAGADGKQVAILIAGGFGLGLMVALLIPYQRDRILGHFFNSPGTAAAQKEWLEQMAHSAGVFGQGLDGIQDFAGRFNGAHMDFIFGFITYGFGVFTALVVVAVFLFLGYRTVQIARKAPDDLGMLISVGIGSWLLIQALIHIGVNIGVAPITGLTLPFISYGGNSLVACLVGIGILLNVSKAGESREIKRNAVYAHGGRNRRPRLSGTHRRSGASRNRER